MFLGNQHLAVVKRCGKVCSNTPLSLFSRHSDYRSVTGPKPNIGASEFTTSKAYYDLLGRGKQKSRRTTVGRVNYRTGSEFSPRPVFSDFGSSTCAHSAVSIRALRRSEILLIRRSGASEGWIRGCKKKRFSPIFTDFQLFSSVFWNGVLFFMSFPEKHVFWGSRQAP